MVKLNKKGESLFEALCALAILVIVVSALATVITKTAAVNKTIRERRIAFNESNKQVVSDIVIQINLLDQNGSTMGGATNKQYDKNGITVYKDETKNKDEVDSKLTLYYYECNK